MTKILKKQTAGDYFITDMGVNVPGEGELTIDPAQYTLLNRSENVIAGLSNGDIVYNDGSKDLSLNDAIDHIKGYQQKSPITEDGRYLVAENRIPAGFSIYVTGVADDISSNSFGDGDVMSFDSSNPVRGFQMINHWYAIGAHATWINCSEENYFDAILYAPAANISAQAGGAYIISNGVIVPVGIGNGTHTLTLSEKIGSSNVLRNAPVPIAGNTGFFDYDKDTNAIIENPNGTGGYHLFTVDINLHAFGRKIWGTPQNGAKTDVHVPGLVGKLLYNFWKVKITFAKNGGSISTEKANVKFSVGAQGNV